MSDDPLFAALKDVARAREGDAVEDATWEARARGALSAEAEAALQRRAASDPFVRHMLGATAPRADDEAFFARAAGAAGVGASGGGARGAAESTPAVRAAKARWGGRARLVASVAGLAVAAALLLFVRARRADDGDLPPYAVEIEGYDRAERSSSSPAPSSPPEASPGARLAVVARPATPVSGPIAARAFARCEGGALREIHAVKAFDTGTVRVEESVEALFGREHGACAITVVVGPPAPVGRARGDESDANALPGVRVLRADLVVLAGAR